MAEPRKARRGSRTPLLLLVLLGALVLLWWIFRSAGREPTVAEARDRAPLTQPALPAPQPGPTPVRAKPPGAESFADARGVFIRRIDGGPHDADADGGAQGAAAPGSSSIPPAPDDRATPLALALLTGETGTLEGEVTVHSAPVDRPIKMTADPVCAKFGTAKSPVSNIDGGFVGDALVRIETVSSLPPPSEPVVVAQRGCQYSPRVQGAVRGQSVVVRNEDGTLHNVHVYSGAKTLFNQAQPPASAPLSKAIDPATSVVKLACDVHPWMKGYVVLNNNPYFAVTDPEGHFRIEGAPAGRYPIRVWHEALGERTLEVRVERSKTTHVTVAY